MKNNDNTNTTAIDIEQWLLSFKADQLLTKLF